MSSNEIIEKTAASHDEAAKNQYTKFNEKIVLIKECLLDILLYESVTH